MSTKDRESMMRRISWTIALLLLAGCGGASDDASTSQLSAPSSQTPIAGDPGNAARMSADPDTPAYVVGQFYEALGNRDDQAISRLLTDEARDETAKNDLEIRLQENTKLTYEIGETEYVTEGAGGAHVGSLWTETDQHGQEMALDVVWILRRQTDGWRIAGFAQVFENELPVVSNFEDPDQMRRTKEHVENRAFGDENQSVPHTATPEAPASTNTRIR